MRYTEAMARSVTWYPYLRNLLPPDDPMAGLMARLFVLWQDLLFEHEGIRAEEGFQGMDQVDPSGFARRMYFLRGNSRTLVSAKVLFEALETESRFQSWLAEEKDMRAAYREAIDIFNRHRRAVEWVRNTIGAHAKQDVGKAVKFFTADDQTRFEVHAQDFMRPHVAMDVLLAALSRDAQPDPKSRLDAYRAAIKPLALATRAMIQAMSIIVHVYMTRFDLIPK